MKSVLKGKGVVSRDSQKGGEVITLGDGRKVSFISRYLSLFPKSVPLLSLSSSLSHRPLSPSNALIIIPRVG
jgi:hypothetical protein